MLQVEWHKRIGAGEKDSDNDYRQIRQHAFFRNIDFESLNSLKMPFTRKASESTDLSKNDSFWCKSGNPEVTTVYKGELKKKNKFFWSQVRTFVLFSDGKLNYYKDKALLRGCIRLTADSKVVKTAKDKFEIVTPSRTYFLNEAENSKLSSETWIDKIREVITALH